MRTPDRVTTETGKRPGSQIADQLTRNGRPLKPHQAHSKTRRDGDRKQSKAVKGSPVTVEPGPTVLQRILNKGDSPIKAPAPMGLGHMTPPTVTQRILHSKG